MAMNNNKSDVNTYRYTNETFSGCDMVATITINLNLQDPVTKQWSVKPYTKVIGELTTVSYSINMDKKPIRSIGNVNAKDYVMGQRTIAGSLVFSVFNKHFAEDIISHLNAGYTAGTAFLVDELPPFDLTISAANEYGYRSRLAIYGIRLLNEGQVMSINDVYTENTYQFFATDLEYLSAEMKYSRNNATKMYILRDNLETHSAPNILIPGSKIQWTKEQQDAYEKILDRPITLQAVVKQPTRTNSSGIVDLILDPAQDEGIFYITNSQNEKITAKLSASSTNRNRKLSLSLPPEKYSVYFENIRNKNISNTVTFSINEYYIKDLLKKYAPLIERVTDTTIRIFANEPSHTKVIINEIGSQELGKEFDIVKRRCEITGLEPDKKYTLYTINDIDQVPSRSVTVTTLSSKDSLFNQLLLFCMANSSYLIFKDMVIYKELLKEAQTFAENNDLDTTDSLLEIKKKYMNLYNNSKDEDLIDEYDLKIKALNELIAFSMKLFNDFISAVNDKIEVPIPTMKYNAAYENVFKFDESIENAEFFKDYGHISQLYYIVPNYNFKKIDGEDNSFRFQGRPGHKHYVEATIKTARSPKLEFYVMTQNEKDTFIEKDKKKNNLTDKDVDIIDTSIKKDDLGDLETDDYKRAFLIKAKRIDNPIFLPVDVESIEENVLVKNPLASIVNKNFNDDYYLAVASYQDVLQGNPIYKVKFTNRDELIAITKMLHGLKENNTYALWIENTSGIQLSNPSTFVYSESFDLNNTEMKEYEIKEVIDEILSISNEILPTNIYENIVAIIQNNDTIENSELITNLLSSFEISMLSKTRLNTFISNIKYYLGLMISSSDSLIESLDCNNDICNFKSKETGTVLLYSISEKGCYTDNFPLSAINNINLANYDDIILLVCFNKDLTKKSNVVLINKNEKYLEVI